MQHEAFHFDVFVEPIDQLIIAKRAECSDTECLGLTTGKQGRTVGTGQQINLRIQGSDRLRRSTVRTNFFFGNQTTYFFFDEAVVGGHGTFFDQRFGAVTQSRDHFVFDRIQGRLASQFFFDLNRFDNARLVSGFHHRNGRCIERGDFKRRRFFSDDLFDFENEINQFFDRFVTKHDRIDHVFFAHLSGTGFDHVDRRFGSGNNQINVRGFQLCFGGVDDEFTVHTAHHDARDGGFKRYRGNRQRQRRTKQCRHLRRMVFVAGHDGVDDLNFVLVIIGKQGTKRSVNQASGQGF